MAEECRGLIFRFRREFYINPATGEIMTKDRLRPLKKMSCPGCAVCTPPEKPGRPTDLQYYMEHVRTWSSEEMESIVRFPDDVSFWNTGDLIRGKWNYSTDYETGVCDDWWLDLFKVSPVTLRE